MKHSPIVLAIICLLLTACAGTPSPTLATTPAPRATPRVPNRVYYTKRCWPACHYDPAFVHDLSTVSIDDFDGALTSDWTWINENPTHWTLTEVPGALRIVSQGGSISDGLQGAQNVLVRPAPAGHFDITAEVTFNPTSDFQNAAIFIQLDGDRLVSLSRGYCQEGDGSSCVGSGIYFFDGSKPDSTYVGVPTLVETAYLMLRKAGNSYIGYWLDGGDWVEVGRCFTMMSPASVGLAATCADCAPGAPEIPADFDSFTLHER